MVVVARANVEVLESGKTFFLYSPSMNPFQVLSMLGE